VVETGGLETALPARITGVRIPLPRSHVPCQVDHKCTNSASCSEAGEAGTSSGGIFRTMRFLPHLPQESRFPLYRNPLKHLLDAAQSLPCPFFVFDQREADVAISVLAKTNPWTDGNLGFSQQLL
jgi:hypothetical protein